MIKKSLIITAIAASLLTFGGHAFAEEQQPSAVGPLMTQQENQAFQEQMRNAQTPEERQQIQEQHHQLIQERAKARSDAQRKAYDERKAASDAEYEKQKAAIDAEYGHSSGPAEAAGKNEAETEAADKDEAAGKDQ